MVGSSDLCCFVHDGCARSFPNARRNTAVPHKGRELWINRIDSRSGHDGYNTPCEGIVAPSNAVGWDQAPVCTENLKSDHSGDEVRQGWRVI
jgi:hypothetical protein